MVLAERVVTQVHIEDVVSVLLHFNSVFVCELLHFFDVFVCVLLYFVSVMALCSGRLLYEPCCHTRLFVNSIEAFLFAILHSIACVFRLVLHGMLGG